MAAEVVISSTGDEVSKTITVVEDTRYNSEEVVTTVKEEMEAVEDSCVKDEAASSDDEEVAYGEEVLGVMYDDEST